MTTNTSTATAMGPAANLADRELTASDIETGRLYLQEARSYVIGATKGLSESQWQFRPAHKSWSIAEIVNHMVVVLELVLGPICAQLTNAPPPSADFDHKRVDEIVIHQISARLRKFPAPPAVQPTGQLAPAVALDRLLNCYERLAEYLESTPDLRQHVRDSPPLKAISNSFFESVDGYHWILTAAGHTERHTKQILEVKADPRSPAI